MIGADVKVVSRAPLVLAERLGESVARPVLGLEAGLTVAATWRETASPD